MSSTLFALFIVFLSAFAFRAMLNNHVRERYTPWVAAIYVFTACAYRFILNPKIVHLLLILIYYLSIGFLFNGFKVKSLWKNKAFWAFVPLMLYQFLAFRWGMFSKQCAFQWLYVIMYSYAPGYCIASWMMEREDGMARLLKPMACAITALGFVFVLFGALSGGFSSDERTALGSTYGGDALNVNSIALIMDFVLVWIAIFLPMAFQTSLARAKRLSVLLKLTFAFGSFLVVIVLLKTGSRNGALALVPIFYYMVFCFKGMSFSKKFGIGTLFAVALVGFVLASGSSFTKLRIFDYNAGYTGDITNGRRMYHQRWIDNLIDNEKMWGIGALTGSYDSEYPGMANGHSVYFQIFIQTGYVGSTLFIIAMLFMFMMFNGVRSADGVNWKWLGRVLFFAWILTGVAESVNYISDMPSPKIGFAIAMAICAQRDVLKRRERQLMRQMPMRFGGW